ncbi:MAG: glycosyltransferase [Archaeoglobaceae archaeon]
MKVSIILCTYSPAMFDHFKECLESLINQTYPDVEILCIVDGNEEYHHMITDKLSDLVDDEKVRLTLNDENLGLTESRNRGVKLANGDVVAFIDDDAVAEPNWLEELVKMYTGDVVAAGGKLIPIWMEGKPRWFPEEFYWMIGATHLGFPEEITEVRNTFGSNLSFRKEVFLEVGGFNPDFGVKGKGQLQAEEAELCDRVRKRFDRGVIYNPDAIVHHKIFGKRTKIKFLIKRSFWQGYSKAVMEGSADIGEERKFLKYLLGNRTLSRLGQFFRGSGSDLVKLIFVWLFTFFVGIGYIYSKVRR